MLAKEIKYVDFLGQERTETFHFNLSKSEVLKMELGVSGGLTRLIKTLLAEQNSPKLIDLYEKIILDSYGVISPDGRQFIKNEEVRNSFAQTDAYNQLFMELLTDENKAMSFIRAIVPVTDEKPLTNDHNKPALTLTGEV